jgi:hypothetical protein
MNRKLIILSISIIVVAIVIGGVFYFNTMSNKKKVETTTKPKATSSIYKVETDSLPLAKIAKNAVENFLTQNITESSADRNNRLKEYFTADSPVYGYSLDILLSNPEIIRTSANATSITGAAADAGIPTLQVKADVTSYTSSGQTTSTKSYWVTLQQNANESYAATDIGLWDN